MTFTRVLAASVFALLIGCSLGSPTTVEAELLKSSIIRRHNQEKTVGMTHKAEIASFAADINKGNAVQQSKPREPEYANHEFKIADTNTPNQCTNAQSISDAPHCQEAANRLGYTYNGTFDNSWVHGADAPIPQNCSVQTVGNDKFVHYWSGASVQESQMDGQQICFELKYRDGQWQNNAVVCPTGYAEVGNDFDECTKAYHAVEGLNGCAMDAFGQGSRSILDNRPKGCFREPAHQGTGNNVGQTGSRKGCFNFNEIAPTQSASGNPVCKLSSPMLS